VVAKILSICFSRHERHGLAQQKTRRSAAPQRRDDILAPGNGQHVSRFEELIMKKTFAIAALAAITATVGFAGSANAAPSFVANNINARQAQLEQRINQGQRMGRLTFSEVRDLRGELRGVSMLEARYRRGGLSFSERADLNRRLDRVQFDIQRQMNDRDHRPRR